MRIGMGTEKFNSMKAEILRKIDRNGSVRLMDFAKFRTREYPQYHKVLTVLVGLRVLKKERRGMSFYYTLYP